MARLQLQLSVPAHDGKTVEDLPPLALHWHVNLTITIRGEPRAVPARIGIASELWNDHSLDAYGISELGLAPLHTHTAWGRIHIESIVVRDYTLGEFFAIWGQPSGPDRVLDATTAPGEELVMVASGVEQAVDPGLVFLDEMTIHIILR